jgi:protein-S-isoprenylcysteine O-methyltransferase Ste14
VNTLVRGADNGARVDAPAFRIWPPLALGVPLGVGLLLTANVGDPFALPDGLSRWVGSVLIAVFAVWNGWTLMVMASNRTSILPGGSTTLILRRGPFLVSRNPLYVGLIFLDAGLALIVPSAWGLLSLPVGVAALWWGAVIPEERYLAAKFGEEYDAYRARVRRWL